MLFPEESYSVYDLADLWVETLPPQQRKILDQIARISAQTREGLTPTEIAAATRLPVNQVSSQLKRLADDGYVRAANIRSRSSYYTLSEPLYAIWHQMRFGRDARKRTEWLVSFLKHWYDAKELGRECQRLYDLFTTQALDNVKPAWEELVQHARETEEDETEWLNEVSEVIRFIAEDGHWTLARELITSADLEQPLFPLARALEYLIDCNEAIIEKLSPEVRTIVNEIVTTLKKAAGDKPAPTKKASSRKKKSK